MSIARIHHGEILVDSDMQQGTVFTVQRVDKVALSSLHFSLSAKLTAVKNGRNGFAFGRNHPVRPA